MLLTHVDSHMHVSTEIAALRCAKKAKSIRKKRHRERTHEKVRQEEMKTKIMNGIIQQTTTMKKIILTDSYVGSICKRCEI